MHYPDALKIVRTRSEIGFVSPVVSTVRYSVERSGR